MKILSLNGGGSLGYITIYILEKLEEELGVLIRRHFDLISGVSTGSIIGYGLSCGISAREIRLKYLEFIPEIFKKKRGFLRSFFSNYYRGENLEGVLGGYFKNRKLREISTNFMTYACRLNDPATRPEFWKSWKESGEIEAYKAICASCSAPLYFDPYKIGKDYYTDGAIVSNSPNIASIVEARKLGHNTNKIKIMNFGYLTYTDFSKKSLIGLIRVASNAASMSVGGTEYMEEHQAKYILPEGNYLGLFLPCYGLGLDSLDIKRMNTIADQFLLHKRREMISFLRS